jgi:hypothetical protein
MNSALVDFFGDDLSDDSASNVDDINEFKNRLPPEVESGNIEYKV